MKDSLRKTQVEISRGTISFSGSFGGKRQLSQNDIVLAEEPSLGAGIYLRTSNRYRYFLIPRKLDGYDTIKNELTQRGIVIVKTTILPNWEEFLGVLLFIGTTVCAISAQNVRVLTVNLFVALLISFGGYYVISANPDALPRMRWARFGAFLPVLFAALGLWLAVVR